MANTHDLGRLFWAVQPYDPKQTRYRFLERGDCAMIEPPWRQAKPLVFMLPKVPWVLILGYWDNAEHDEDSVPPGITIVGEQTDSVRDWVPQ